MQLRGQPSMLFISSAHAPLCSSASSFRSSSLCKQNSTVSVSAPQHRTPSIRRLRASASPEQDRPAGNTPDDELLQTELREKVNELFGGRQNVKIDIDKDVPSVQFTVGNRPNTRTPTPSISPSSSSSSSAIINDVFRSRRYILTFIVLVSLVTGTFFTALYYSGAVHGLDTNDDSHYQMPTYGTDSYIDPYELLDRESQQQQQEQ